MNSNSYICGVKVCLYIQLQFHQIKWKIRNDKRHVGAITRYYDVLIKTASQGLCVCKIDGFFHPLFDFLMRIIDKDKNTEELKHDLPFNGD